MTDLTALYQALQAPQNSQADVYGMMDQAGALQRGAMRRRITPNMGRGPMGAATMLSGSNRANRDEGDALAMLKQAYEAQSGIDSYAAQVAQIQEVIKQLEAQGMYEAYGTSPEEAALRSRNMDIPAAPKDERTTDVKNYEYRQGLTPEDQAAFDSMGGGQTINVNPTNGNKWEGKRQELAIDENQGLYTRGAQARDDLIDYDMGLRLLDRVETGAFSENINEAKKVINAFGGDFDPNKIADFEGLAPVFGKLTMAKIQETKGAVSNKEMEMFQRMNANYTYTTEGNRRLLEFAKAKAQRDLKIRQLIGEQRQANKSPMEISAAVDQYVQENDLSGMLETLVGGGPQKVGRFTIEAD